MTVSPLLGAADLDDDAFRAVVASLLDEAPDRVEVVERSVVEFPSDLAAITTAARHVVRGTARTPSGCRRFGLFVKQIHCWSRSPLFVHIPPELRETAADLVPWRTEADVYRSALRDRLPDGLTMPRAARVDDLDELSCALWLEEVPLRPVTWTPAVTVRAARLLGRLAGSAAVATTEGLWKRTFRACDYLDGRLTHQVLPLLRSDIWRHPLVAAGFDDALRRDLLAAADRVEALVAELDALPALPSHGDSCPANLLVRDAGPVVDDDALDLVLVDFGFWNRSAIGFDLAQLLVGDVQLGNGDPDDLGPRTEPSIAAYVAGLADEGVVVDPAVVRRGLALKLLVYSGLSAVPLDLIGREPSPSLTRELAARPVIARFCLDLEAATRGTAA